MLNRSRLMPFLAALGFLALAPEVPAQTGPSRPTACSPSTPWDAVCVTLTAPTTYTDGTPFPTGTAISYRVEDKVGSGSFATVAHTGSASTGLLVSGLAPGAHVMRVYATVNAVESGPSNLTNKPVTTGVPNAPVITIAVNIQPGAAPVVMEVQAKVDQGYRCTVKSSPRGFRVANTCKAS